MRKALVTISTDGLRDYVALPTGEKVILGTVSIVRFVTELSPHIGLARQVLDSFLSTGEAMLTVDLDRMEEMFLPRRARWSSDRTAIPLMGGSDRTATTRERQTMSDVKTLQGLIQNRLAAIEDVVSTLDKHAGQGLIAPKFHAKLRGLAAKVAEDLGPESAVPVPPGSPVAIVTAPEKPEAAPVADPSFSTFQANSAIAEDILAKVEATGERIDQLVTAGRKFNASKAKDDLYVIANGVTEIVNSVDLAQPWVQTDLDALAKQANNIHALFAPAKL